MEEEEMAKAEKYFNFMKNFSYKEKLSFSLSLISTMIEFLDEEGRKIMLDIIQQSLINKYKQ